MGFLDRLSRSEDEWERDRWWLRTDGVDELPPDDYDEAADLRAREEADERDIPLDPRSGYHRYDDDPDFADGVPILDPRGD